MSGTVHHPDCDGWRHHHVSAVAASHAFGTVTYRPVCNLCGALPVVGSASSPSTAISLARGHESAEQCEGQCLEWDLPQNERKELA